jgi:DNA invertase Pin-like site-specific DNA recombinase
MMPMYGYARVSSLSQSTEVQVSRLKAVGCDVVRKEAVSGHSRIRRTELATILEFIRPGDTLVVAKLDRLGRSTRDVLNLVHELESKGAALRVLEPEIDTSRPEGRIILTSLSMVAEMELTFLKERQRAGIEAAKAKGIYKGRKRSIDRDAVSKLHKEGVGATEIARRLGIGRASVYKVLAAPASQDGAEPPPLGRG